MASLLRHMRSNAGIPQGSIIVPNLFLHYINDLAKNTLRHLVNMYPDDSTVYGCTYKYLDNQCLSADLSSDLTLTVQWENNWLITFNNSKAKLVTFHHHQADVVLSNYDELSMKLLVLNISWDLSLLQSLTFACQWIKTNYHITVS